MFSPRVGLAWRPNVLVISKLASTTSEVKSTQLPNPRNIKTDMVGPPDPVSNLRSVIFRKPLIESSLERKYRKLRGEVQEWNHVFWTQHNSRFFKEREAYLKSNLPEGKTNLTADEMSVFYKAFLDKNWRAHIDYNREWYKKNITLLILSLQVKFRKLFKIKE